MKTNYFIYSLVILFILTGCSKDDEIEKIPSEAFSDLLFEKYILQNFDIDKDGMISITEAMAVKEINCPDMRITSLKGIQYFTELEKLNCSNNGIKDFDLTKNTSLKELYCDDCDFGETIDISNNTLLERFHCSNNYNIKTLLLKNNTNLLELFCNNNHNLSSLDISFNKNLQILSCGDNPNLESINVKNNTNLKELYSGGLIITGLDSHSLLEKLELTGTNVQTINIKGSPLKILDCYIDDLLSLDISGCNNLESLKLKCRNFNNRLNIKLDNCSSLKYIDLGEYWPESLDVSSCVSLKSLRGNTDVDISRNTELEEVNVINIINDIKNNKNLKKIFCYSIKNVDIFDLSNQTVLEELSCVWIDVPLDISKCTALKRLTATYDIEEEKITYFTIKGMPNLESIEYNHKVSLSIEECPKLNRINASRLTDFCVSNCAMLDFLSCSDGSLKEINIDNCPNITLLECSNNPITNLSLGALTNLISLYCSGCSLSELDLRKNKKLDILQCQENPDLKFIYVTHSIPKMNNGGATMVYSDE